MNGDVGPLTESDCHLSVKVNRVYYGLVELVMNPGKHQSRKQRGQDLGWKVHDRAHLLFFTC